MFSEQTVAALVIGAVLAFAIPIAAVIIYKVRNRSVWLPSVLVGAGTFIAFAMILEQILHMIMLPIVRGNAISYVIYGALAAGIFEETGRYAAYKFVMKNHLSTKNAVMMGIGHGGCEAILMLGFTMISYAGCAIMVNSQGLESAVELLAAGNAEVVDSTRAQLEALAAYGFGNMALSIYERLIAMIFHVCMSVIVYHAVSQNGKTYLYPLAVLLHALLDTPVAMYQIGIIGLPMTYAIITVFTAIVAGCTVVMSKKYSDNSM